MKKILFTLIIIAGAFQLKAQQKFGTVDSMLFKAPKNPDQFKLGDSSLFRNFAPKQNQLALLNNLRDGKNTEIFYSTMPVLKIGGRNDNMAIIKPQSNEHYTMLIKRIKVVNPLATTNLTAP